MENSFEYHSGTETTDFFNLNYKIKKTSIFKKLCPQTMAISYQALV